LDKDIGNDRIMAIQFDPDIVEIRSAYDRAKNDRPNRCFIEYPYLIKWTELDLSEWLANLKEKCTSGFQPHSSRICWIPKANSLLRPGNILHFKDEVVYNLLLDRLYDSIWKALKSFQKEPDAAYVLTGKRTTAWFQSSFTSWEEFRTKSLEYLQGGTNFIVVADITGFYENIDTDKLLSDLRQIVGRSKSEIDLLRDCLRKWSARGEKGIPQGYSASDLLAKVYANPIDIALRNDGYRHLRYVDDIRIFCRSKIEAKRAILSLSTHIHKRGLNLQSAKTKILSTADAFKEFDGVKPI
jgi:retron-type reverse transcriptase